MEDKRSRAEAYSPRKREKAEVGLTRILHLDIRSVRVYRPNRQTFFQPRVIFIYFCYFWHFIYLISTCFERKAFISNGKSDGAKF